MQLLSEALKVPQTKVKKIEVKNKRPIDSVISSPNISTPVRNSQFYNDYKDKMKDNVNLLKEPLVATNYIKKFRHLLCWEEQEHDKQLTQR